MQKPELTFVTSRSYVDSRDICKYSGANLSADCAENYHASATWNTVSGVEFFLRVVSSIDGGITSFGVIVVYIVGVK